MLEKLKQIESAARAEIEKAGDENALETVRLAYLGRKGKLPLLLRGMKDLSDEEKRAVGPAGNKLRQDLESLVAAKSREFLSRKYQDLARREKIDVTEPGIPPEYGELHIITQTRYEIEEIFKSMGYEITSTPEVDSEYYCFTSLNFPADHPARSDWDTFKLENGMIPRVHTSTAQNRVMKTRKPPIRAINPGRCFRNERTDARHEHTFYQVEGFYVDEGVSIANLAATMSEVLYQVFKKKIEHRLRPGYFPFVEPGFELDIKCQICGGKGCPVCKYTSWVELWPCGMIHPNVLKEAGVDPEKYSGFAFGLGLDRLVMMRYKINDIRLFHRGDLRFLKQF